MVRNRHPKSHLAAVMFTDLVGSVQLETNLGAAAYSEIIEAHNDLFRRIVQSTVGAEIRNDTGDGFLAKFETGSGAVAAALRFQHAIHHLDWEEPR